MKELTARIKAIVRRSEPSRNDDELKTISVRQLEIDPSIRKVTLDDERIDLTPKEFELLYLLASNPGVTFTRSELLNKVWGYDFDGYEHTVNSHINRLRMKVEDDPAKPSYVLTTWGVGYRFADA
jgi:DNA-binding response OmpR family regulator